MRSVYPAGRTLMSESRSIVTRWGGGGGGGTHPDFDIHCNTDLGSCGCKRGIYTRIRGRGRGGGALIRELGTGGGRAFLWRM